ncbi:MAG TPA: ABC transporter permease, partial [Chryseosolibacter sp.]|nr:ABC transporter permease [Chryseosolibacter sp.]
MIKNYLLITWRSMMKNKFFIFINVLGLAVAIACSIVAYFNWEFDATFNDHHINANKVYRVSSIREFEERTRLYGYAPLPLGNIIRENIPEAEKVVRLSWSYSNFKIGDNLFPGELVYADPDFFDVFTFEMVAGNPADLKNKSRLFVSDEMALKLFGTVDAVGKPVTHVMGPTLKEYIIGGVFRKQPSNSSFINNAYTHYENYFDEAKDRDENDWKSRNTLFVQISDPSRVETVSRQIQQYKENNNQVRADFQISEFKLDP